MCKLERLLSRAFAQEGSIKRSARISVQMASREDSEKRDLKFDELRRWLLRDKPQARPGSAAFDVPLPRVSHPRKPKRPREAEMEDPPSEALSPFYNLLDGAFKAVLAFPADDDSIGPFWNERGELDLDRGPSWSDEAVAVVPLGENRYRLAQRMDGPVSQLRLYWGDEFMAEPTGGDELTLRSVVMPRRFAHFRFPHPGFGNRHPLAEQVHAMGGGWELLAQYFLTLTVPAERATEFQRLMREEGSAPRVLERED